MNIYSYSKGDPKNPCVICLHGLLGSSRNLYRLAETIASSGFFVLAYDQRGHGHSDHAHDYTLPLMAQDAFDLLDSKGVRAAHFVGHSLGARVSLKAAALRPERVLSLALLDAGMKIGPRASHSVRKIVESLPDSYPSREAAEAALSDHTPAMRQFLISNLRTRDGELRWVFDLNGIKSAMLDALYMDQSSDWKATNCPTLIMRGEKSDHFIESEIHAMLSLRPDAKIAVVPDAGHWLHVDNFENTAQTIVRFLQAVTKQWERGEPR